MSELDPFEPTTRGHRWSGWPGAWCLDCGIEDPREACLAHHNHGVDDRGYPTIPPECCAGDCPEPNSKRHDPYAAAAEATRRPSPIDRLDARHETVHEPSKGPARSVKTVKRKSTTLDEKRIAELRALCNAATPGPWFRCSPEQGDIVSHCGKIGHINLNPGVPIYRSEWSGCEANRLFIVAARDEFSEALAEVERLREILGNVEFYLRNSGLAEQCSPVLLEQIKPFKGTR